MDEVIVDFISGACKAHGTNYEAVLPHWLKGSWDMKVPLSRALGRSKPQDTLTPTEFWKPIDGDRDFWLNLEPLPWAHEVIELVKQYTDDWHIISSPSYCHTSYDGKVHWLKRYFGKDFNNFALTPHKHIFAGTGVTLIDDRDMNVEQFMWTREGVRTGGNGIVFPRHQNSNHPYVGFEIAYLRQSLNLLANFNKEAV